MASSTAKKTLGRTLKLSDLSEGFLFSDFDWVVGVDEVGAGCLAGPVVAAAFAYPTCQATVKFKVPVRVFDSKILNEKVRGASSEWLLGWESGFSKIVEVSNHVIDEINILQARFRAMTESVTHLIEKIPAGSRVGIFVDGSVIPPALKIKFEKSHRLAAVVKGDAKVFAVAAASIIAKEYRDSLMTELAKEFPDFGWERNVGYPTPDHKEALRRVGPSHLHRRSFQWDRSL